MDIFLVLLSIALILWGITVFVQERVLIVIAGIAAIVAGVIGLIRSF